MAILSHKNIKKYFINSDQSTSFSEKGRILEDLVCYLFEQVPGVNVGKRNALNTFSSEEIDVAFWNRMDVDGFYFLPNIILVECKNWSQPVGSEEVNWFDSKLKRRGQPFGILVAANGITGNSQKIQAAHEIIRVALSEGRQLIVITRLEIENLRTSDNLVKLIQDKLCELIVSGTLFL
jgi:Restriction endonuclease